MWMLNTFGSQPCGCPCGMCHPYRGCSSPLIRDQTIKGFDSCSDPEKVRMLWGVFLGEGGRFDGKITSVEKRGYLRVRGVFSIWRPPHSEGTFVVPDPCPQIDGMLESGMKAVEEAKKMVHEVLKVRRAFFDALGELKETNAQSQQVLDGIRGEIQAFLQAGMADIVEQITAADRLFVRLDTLEEACNDADAYRATSAKFVEKVEAAQQAVTAGKEELARKEAEREARVNAQDDLSNFLDQLKSEPDKLKEKAEMFFSDESHAVVEDVRILQVDILPKINKLRTSAWTMPIEQLEEETREVLEIGRSKLQAAQDRIKAMQEQNKRKFKERASMFQGK